jgi:hypothetical protein
MTAQPRCTSAEGDPRGKLRPDTRAKIRSLAVLLLLLHHGR